jgi:hypothetical protein
MSDAEYKLTLSTAVKLPTFNSQNVGAGLGEGDGVGLGVGAIVGVGAGVDDEDPLAQAANETQQPTAKDKLKNCL